MLHKFFEEGYWFEAKKLGYGAGLPIAWQGWVLLVGYIGLVIGLSFLGQTYGAEGTIVAVVIIVLLSVPFLMIAKRRTKGGWKWRS